MDSLLFLIKKHSNKTDYNDKLALKKYSCKCPRISQRLFFIRSPWTRCYKSPEKQFN